MRSASPTRSLIIAFWIGSSAILLVYYLVYRFYPFAATLNNLILNAGYLVCTISPAWVVTSIWRRYEKNEPHRRIWMYFMIGFWAWAMAEFTWVVYNWFEAAVPDVNLSDPFYLIGYFFLTAAIAGQYRLIRRAPVKVEVQVMILIWSGILIGTLLLLILTRSSGGVGAMLENLYAVSNFTLGLAGVLMLTVFQSGALGRPWWGFIAFSLSDIFYAWILQVGGSNPSVDLRALSDLVYMLSYLLIAYGFLQHYALLRFGPPEVFKPLEQNLGRKAS